MSESHLTSLATIRVQSDALRQLHHVLEERPQHAEKMLTVVDWAQTTVVSMSTLPEYETISRTVVWWADGRGGPRSRRLGLPRPQRPLPDEGGCPRVLDQPPRGRLLPGQSVLSSNIGLPGQARHVRRDCELGVVRIRRSEELA